MNNSRLTVSGNPLDRENLVGKGGGLLRGSRSIDTRWQPLEAIGEVEIWVVEGKVAQDQKKGITSKLSGLIGKANGSVVLIRL